MQPSIRGDGLAIDDARYRHWIADIEAAQSSAAIAAAWQHCGERTPLISILLPTYDSDAAFLRAALDSVLAQIYPHWQLCVVDDASRAPAVRPLLQEYARRDSRIRLQFQDSNGGIAAATNCALALATGEYVALLDHDDVLAPHALLCVAAGIVRYAPQLIYSDSDCLDANGRRIEPFFKPGWNYDLLLGQNYVNHLTVYHRQRLLDVGGWREGFEGSQDYDVLLRVIEGLTAADIHHIPAILYHWRQVPDSVSRSNLGAAVRAARSAIREHLRRTGQIAQVKPCTGAVLYSRIEWPAKNEPVAIAVYGRERAAVDAGRARLQRLDATLEVSGIVLEGDDPDCKTLNEWATRRSTPLLGFIAAGFEMQPETLATLRGHVNRPAIAAASAKLIDSNGRPRGPLVLAGDSIVTAHGAAPQADNSGYVAGLLLDRQVFALQAGCLFVDAALFRQAGGWTRSPCDSLLAGVELSLRLRACGGSLVWSGQAAAFDRSATPDAGIGDACASVAELRSKYTATDWLDRNANPNLTP